MAKETDRNTLSVMYRAPGCLQIKQISGKTFEDLEGQSFTFLRVDRECRVVRATFLAFKLISGCPILCSDTRFQPTLARVVFALSSLLMLVKVP